MFQQCLKFSSSIRIITLSKVSWSIFSWYIFFRKNRQKLTTFLYPIQSDKKKLHHTTYIRDMEKHHMRVHACVINLN